MDEATAARVRQCGWRLWYVAMSVGSLSSRKRVWSGSAADTVDAVEEQAHLARPHKQAKRTHTQRSLPPLHSSAPPTAHHSPRAHPHEAAPPLTPPPIPCGIGAQLQSQPPPPLPPASTLSQLAVAQHTALQSFPPATASAAPLPAPLRSVSAVRVNKKRNSAELHFSAANLATGGPHGSETEPETAGEQQGGTRRKRPNLHSSFTFASALSPPDSPPSPSVPVPAPFVYSSRSPAPLSDSNALLRSLHSERMGRKHQAPGSTADSGTARLNEWPAPPRTPTVTAGDYCLMPLYAGRADVFDSESSWASADSSSQSASGSALQSMARDVSRTSNLLSVARPSIARLPLDAAAVSMSDDGYRSACIQRSNSNESMHDG